MRASLLACSLAACAVPVVPSDDTPTPRSRLDGRVRLADGSAEPAGPTFLFRTDCANPPPPTGTGRPADLLILDEASFRGGEAPFVFPQVPVDSCWVLTGFVDRDRDFDPFLSVANQPTRGDLAMTPLTVVVEPLSDDGRAPLPVTGIDLRADTTVPLDRPAFGLIDPMTGEQGATLQLREGPGTSGERIVRLQTRAIESQWTDVDDPLFTFVFEADGDGDGWPDDKNGDSLPDVRWPRVRFLRLDPGDPAGLATISPPVVLPGIVLPFDLADPFDLATNRVLQSRASGAPFDGTSVLPTATLDVVVPPLVVLDAATSSVADAEAVQASGTDVLGGYQVLVMNASGQTWTVPNELLAAGTPDQGPSFAVESAAPGEAAGTVGGTVDLGVDPEATTYVVRFACDDPPPPEGTGGPLDLDVLPPSRFEDGRAAYRFEAVAPGTCVLVTGFVDVDGDFDAFAGIAQGVTAGDLALTAASGTTGQASGGLVPPLTGLDLFDIGAVPLDPPAFTISGQTTLTRGRSPGSAETVWLQLDATSLGTPWLDVNGPAFTLVFAEDGDDDGLPDDNNGDGLPDVLWPKVLVVRLDDDDPEAIDTIDPPVVLPGIVAPVLPGSAFDPTSDRVRASFQAGLPFDGASVLPVQQLSVAVPGLVVTDLEAQTVTPIESAFDLGLPVDGDYAVVVMNVSGQVWTLPNEAGVLGETTQNDVFAVQPAQDETEALGRVSGTVTAPGTPTGPTVLFQFDCAAPPPPSGSGLPLDFLVLPPSAFAGGVADYRFDAVPPGSCLLLTGFIDADDDWSGIYSVTNQATAGDLPITPLVVVTPELDEETGVVPDLVGRNVTVAGAVPVDRPSFTLSDTAGGPAPPMQLGAAPGATDTVFARLTAGDIDGAIAETAAARFLLVFAPDLDDGMGGGPDGLPDDENGDGLPDVRWPRILMRRLDPTDPAGLATLDPPIVVPGIAVPLDPADPGNPATNLVIQAIGAGVPFDGVTPMPVSGLTFAAPGLVVVDAETLATTPIELVAASGLPVAGDYQVLVMNPTGQTWAIPNELGALGDATQAATFVIED